MHPAKSAPRLNQSRTKPVLVPIYFKIGTMHQLPEKAGIAVHPMFISY